MSPLKNIFNNCISKLLLAKQALCEVSVHEQKMEKNEGEAESFQIVTLEGLC